MPLQIIDLTLQTLFNILKREDPPCKSTIMLAALNSPGQTVLNLKKSRDHTENIKHLGILLLQKNKQMDDRR